MSNYVQLGDVHLLRGGRRGRGPRTPAPGTRGLAGVRGVRARVRPALPRLPARPARARSHARRRGSDHLRADGSDTIAFLERVVDGPAYLLGHSDGAIVALLAALERPDLVLVFSAGVFHHDGWAQERSSWTTRRWRSSSTTGVPSPPTGGSTSGL